MIGSSRCAAAAIEWLGDGEFKVLLAGDLFCARSSPNGVYKWALVEKEVDPVGPRTNQTAN